MCRFMRITIKTTFIMLLATTVATIIIIWSNYRNHDQTREMSSEEMLLILKTRMRHLPDQNLKKQIDRLQASLEGVNATYQSEEENEINPYHEEIMAHLKDISESFPFVQPEAKPEPLQVPFAYTTMQHLMYHPKSRCPAYQVLSPRKKTDVDVVIGIPTVKRQKEEYLSETLQSLIDGMTTKQLARTLIVILIGEATDLKYVVDTAFKINYQFKSYFGQLIEVISPSKYWYPDLTEIKPTLGDSQKRTQWRTKQNLDAIFLMSYAESKGTYYLMLEDDVLAKKGYMTEIMKFAESQTVSNPNWFFINFSTTGGIGKFFRANDLGIFSAYVQVLYKYMPIDWLIELYLASRVCGFDKNTTQCGELKGTIRPTYKKQLFDHIGLFSSLNGKLHNVKPVLRRDRYIPQYYQHKNPLVDKFITNIKSVDNHTIERAYKGEDFFWGITPNVNDTIEFWFSAPLAIDKFLFQSGHPSYMKDIVKRGVVEVLPNIETNDGKFVFLAEFDEFGLSEGSIDSAIGSLTAIRIRILENIPHWIIISEIYLHTAGIDNN